MSKSKNWFVKEAKEVLPAVLFFLIAFSLGDWTDRVMNKYAMTTYSFFSIIVASLVMGKVVMISDHLPFIALFSHKPLLYDTIWKSFVYVTIASCFRLLEHAIPHIHAGESVLQVYDGLIVHIQRPVFWLAHAWLSALFFVFVAYRELIEAVGRERVYRLFFKSRKM
jgi:hypothetical protein